MSCTLQDVYASNLLRRQRIGYPLRNPRPKDKFDPEGFQVGDVGYVDDNGRFNPLFNIQSLPEQLQDRCPNFPLGNQPLGEPELGAGTVIMAGVHRHNLKGDNYEFTTTGKEGAILILPSGAIRFELQGKDKLKQLREHSERYALEWCRFSKQDSLYLVTAMFKSKSWTLGSFYDGSRGKEILVECQPSCDSSVGDRTGTSTYKWKYQIYVDNPEPPQNNHYINQTVLIKGFKMTVRWDWLPIVERAERTEWWFVCFLTSLWSTISRRWLSRIAIANIPALNSSQPRHPLDTINRVLLEKNPGARVAITHDDDWVKMLERGLSPADLTQDGPLREFVLKEHLWGFEPDHKVVYLQDNIENASGEHEPTQAFLSRCDSPRLAIINMRLEGVDIDHIYAGVCVLVQFGSMTKRTENKSPTCVVQWDDEITLPPDGSVSVTICSAFQLGSTLGTREISSKQTFNIRDLSGQCNHIIRFSVGHAEPCSSLLITLGQHFAHSGTFSSYEEESDFAKKTNTGFEALYSYHDHRGEEHLGRALQHFHRALYQHSLDPDCRAAAFFNLATAKFISCQALGTYSKLREPIELYEEALRLRDPGHRDRSATLLLLAQALLSRLGQVYDESIATRIGCLLAEIHSDGSRDRRTADVIMRTCRLYRAMNSNPPQVDELPRDLNCDTYVPPYGYFDRPRILHKMGVVLLERYRHYMNLDLLKKSIALSQEALSLIPDGHEDQACIVACLGGSFLELVEACGDLTDVDLSASLVEIGERVVTMLAKTSMEDAGVSAEKEELCQQVALMLIADTTIQYIEQEVPPPRIPVFQSLLDEWFKAGGISAKCQKQLGLLLSFLEGEGETRMRELLGRLDWPFKKQKTKETVQVLQNHTTYFQGPFEMKLGVKLARKVFMRGSADDVFKFNLPEFHIRQAICDILEGNDGVGTAGKTGYVLRRQAQT